MILKTIDLPILLSRGTAPRYVQFISTHMSFTLPTLDAGNINNSF